MATIRNIVFDFGGVLLDWNPRYLYRDYFKDEGEMEFFLSNVCTPAWNLRLDAGRPFKEAVEELQAEWPQYEEAILKYWKEWPRMVSGQFPGPVALLHELKGKGYRIYGLTNWSAETLRLMTPKYDFFQELDGMVVSGEEKVLKPSPRIYEILLTRYGLQADETVFLDDNAANADGAVAAGIHGILFDNVDSVRVKLAALGVK